MKRHPDLRSYPGEWSFCGGKCDEEDNNSYETAKRELFEETGIVSFDASLFEHFKYNMVFDDEEAGYSMEFFIYPTFINQKIEINPKEHTNYFWCPMELGLKVLTDKIPESRKFFKQFYEDTLI